MKSIKLEHPVKFGDETITQLDFEECRAKHLMDMSLSEMKMSDMFKIASNLSNYPLSVIGELKPKDLSKVLDYVGNELEDFQ